MKSLQSIFFLACISFLFVGCTSNLPHRTYLPVSPTDNTNRPNKWYLASIDPKTDCTIETNAGFNIGYVEFDDEGWFWSYRQWLAVKNEIATEAAHDTNGLTILVFVHGWKNNADFDNDNVETFRAALTNLSISMGNRKVFGVYAGWRGWSVKWDYFPIPFGEELSFYNRKNAAERIGHQGSATQVFTELEQMQREFNTRTNFSRTQLVIIGHSFGGQLVFSAISQILIERLVDATNPNGDGYVRSLGDLVILLNPAFEASQYNNLVSLATAPNLHYRKDQQPVLAILTSKNDKPNSFWFPLGRHLSTLNERTRPGRGTKEVWLFNTAKAETQDEKTAILKTVGHDADYIDYDLTYTNWSQSAQEEANNVNFTGFKKPTYSLRSTLLTNNVTTNMVPYVFSHQSGDGGYAFVLKHRTGCAYGFRPGDPILDVAVDTKIMNGHSDIANTNLIQFLRDFILFNHTNNLYQAINGMHSE